MTPLAHDIRAAEKRLTELRARRRNLIRELAAAGRTQCEIAAQFGISQPNVAYLLSDRSDPRPSRDASNPKENTA